MHPSGAPQGFLRRREIKVLRDRTFASAVLRAQLDEGLWMARLRKQLPACPGTGELKCRNYKGPVDYEIQGEPAGLKPGPARLKGSFKATPEIALQAFRDGDGELTLESGATYRIVMLGHSAGSGTAYFEMRV
jgi:hypothetical protein